MLNYQIALTNVAFDNSYSDVINFKTREEQRAFFKLDALFQNSTLVNFNINNLLETTVVFNAGEEVELKQLMNYNYAIVKGPMGDYYYYFITDIKVLNVTQVTLMLELDVMNTYFLDLDIDDCIIERCHLDRFSKNPVDGKYKFALGKDSLLLNTESLGGGSKVLKTRSKVEYDYSNNERLNAYLSVWCHVWAYAFISYRADGYKVKDWKGEQITIGNDSGFYYAINNENADLPAKNKQPYFVIAFPVDTSKRLATSLDDSSGTKISLINSSSFQQFLADNTVGYAAVLSMKLSTLPPFEYNIGEDFTADENFAYIIRDNHSDKWHNCSIYDNLSGSGGIVLVNYQDFNHQLIGSVESPYEDGFTKQEIISQDKISYEPKLYGKQFKSVKLTNSVNEFEYDILRIYAFNHVEIALNEIICPDVTKQYARIIPSPYSVYSGNLVNSFIGLVSSIDYSMMYSTSQLETYLANNKNFFLQKGLQTITGPVGGMIAGAIHGGPAGAVVGGIAGGVGAIGNLVNSYFQIDNMANAPQQLANVNGNAMFNDSVNKCALFYDTYELIDADMKMAYDYLKHYGYSYGRLGKPKEHINSRKYYNFIKADINIIKGYISNAVRRKIKQIFNNGVTFWNVTDNMFNHDVNNYEGWL